MRWETLCRPVALAIVLAVGLGEARADPQIESLGPRAVAVGEALRAAAMGAAATSLNPAGAALSRSYVIEGTFGYRSQDDATGATASVCDSMTSRVAACLYYDYFAAAPPDTCDRRRHEVGLTLAMPISDKLLIGVTQKYVDHNAVAADGSDASYSGYLADAGLILRVASMLNLAFVGYNLVGSDDGEFPLGLGGGLSVFPTPRLMVSADARWNLSTDDGRYGGGAEYFVAAAAAQQGFPLRAGVVYDQATQATYVTGGLGYITPRVAFDAALRRQVSGEGEETMLLFGLRLFLPN